MRDYLTPSRVSHFWSLVDKSGDCWLWTGNVLEGGYGQFSVDRRIKFKAHRVSWFLTYGDIPAGLLVCHSCDINYPVGDIGYRRCVRPAHLWLGTNKENSEDARRKGRLATGDRSGARLHPERWKRGDENFAHLHPEIRRGQSNGNAKLNESTVREIIAVSREERLSQWALSRRFGISRSTIQNIVTGKGWVHIRRE